MRTLRPLLGLALACVLARPAHAESTGELVAKAQLQWNDLEYDAVLDLAQRALAAGDATTAQKVEALRLEGSALVVLERRDEAAAVFEQLFAIEPDYELPPKSSPRLLTVFAPTRARWQVAEEQRLATELGPALKALALHVVLPAAPRGGRPIDIGVELRDPNGLADRVVLSQRRRGAAYFTTTQLQAHAGRLAFTISGEDSASREPYVLELHVLAKHRSGVALRREGTSDHPLELAIAAGLVPTPTPITHRWWFWTGIAVIAVGGAILVDHAISVGPQRVVGQP